MTDLLNSEICPSLDELRDFIRCPAFDFFCHKLAGMGAGYQMAYSKCSWMPGWNVKFRKSGKGLCTVYPKENYFTVLVVIGRKEREGAETILPECTRRIQELYRQTPEGNGQRWLMIDLEDRDETLEDALRLINLRKK